MKQWLFLVELGAIANKDEMNEIYSQVYDKKYAYYDEFQFYVHSLKEAIEVVQNHTTTEGSYGVVSLQGTSRYTDKDIEDGNIEIKNGYYSPKNVLYSELFQDGKKIINFIEGTLPIQSLKDEEIILEEEMILACDEECNPTLVEYYFNLFNDIEKRYDGDLMPDEAVNGYVLIDVKNKKGKKIYFTMYGDTEGTDDFKVYLSDDEINRIYKKALEKFKQDYEENDD